MKCMRCGQWIWLCLLLAVFPLWAQQEPMKAGVAARKITPPELPFWLSGYAARTKPSERVAQDLYAKALALEGSDGTRAVVVTLDLIGIPRDLRDDIARLVEIQSGLKPDALLLNCSHTHSGPAIRANLEMMFGFNAEDRVRTDRYRDFLRDQVVALVGEALGKLRPARLEYAEGNADFAVNRRALQRNAEDPQANAFRTVDHKVPVLRVAGEDGTLLAVLFGYACHNTTLTGEFLEISGDYAGAAQESLEASHPGAVAMFVMLCGGDQNPHPRSRKELAAEHGQALAKAVDAAMRGKRQPVAGSIRTALVFERLPFELRTKESLEVETSNRNIFKKRRAEWLLKKLEHGEDISAIDYPVQAIRVGDAFGIVGLGGEVVVDYGLRIQREYPNLRLFTAGYTNDVMCYIPTLRVLREGGYEADDSMIYYGQPGPFQPSVEDRVMAGVARAMEAVGWKR